MLTFGWAAIYDLCAHSEGVPREDSIVDLVSAYLGVNPHQIYSEIQYADKFLKARIVLRCVPGIQTHIQNEDQAVLFV